MIYALSRFNIRFTTRLRLRPQHRVTYFPKNYNITDTIGTFRTMSDGNKTQAEPAPADAALPKLSAADFHKYYRMAEHMDQFVRHFPFPSISNFIELFYPHSIRLSSFAAVPSLELTWYFAFLSLFFSVRNSIITFANHGQHSMKPASQTADLKTYPCFNFFASDSICASTLMLITLSKSSTFSRNSRNACLLSAGNWNY